MAKVAGRRMAAEIDGDFVVFLDRRQACERRKTGVSLRRRRSVLFVRSG